MLMLMILTCLWEVSARQLRQSHCWVSFGFYDEPLTMFQINYFLLWIILCDGHCLQKLHQFTPIVLQAQHSDVLWRTSSPDSRPGTGSTTTRGRPTRAGSAPTSWSRSGSPTSPGSTVIMGTISNWCSLLASENHHICKFIWDFSKEKVSLIV